MEKLYQAHSYSKYTLTFTQNIGFLHNLTSYCMILNFFQSRKCCQYIIMHYTIHFTCKISKSIWLVNFWLREKVKYVLKSGEPAASFAPWNRIFPPKFLFFNQSNVHGENMYVGGWPVSWVNQVEPWQFFYWPARTMDRKCMLRSRGSQGDRWI